MTDSTADELPDEPTGTTIDGTPWEEARPPHLPDAVTGLPVPTILFTIGAIIVGILTVRDRLPEAGFGPGPIVWALGLMVPISSFLIPAVFFFRHRDAWTAHRTMALGTTLLAVSRTIQLLNSYLADAFNSIVAPIEDLGISPLSLVMLVLVSLAAILALIYMARGLDQARLYADRPGTRRWWVLVAIVAIASALMNLTLFGTLQTDLADSAFTASYWVTMLSVILNIGTVASWAYFTGQAIAGRRAGEDPNFAWFLAAFSGLCILALFFVSGLATAMVAFTDVTSVQHLSTLVAVLPAFAYIALLAAFALRLPTTHAPLDEPDDDIDAVELPDPGDAAAEAPSTPDDLAGSTA